MQRSLIRSYYLPRVLVLIGVIVMLALILFVQNALSGTVSGITQV